MAARAETHRPRGRRSQDAQSSVAARREGVESDARRAAGARSLPAGWTPELVEALKHTAVEAGFRSDKLALASLGDAQYTVSEPVSGVVSQVARRIVVWVDTDATGAAAIRHWREMNGPLSVVQRALTDGYEFPREERLADRTLGYFVRAPRTDDCLAAAVATVLQVPISDVPDPRIDERLAAGGAPADVHRDAKRDMALWLARRRLRMVVHRRPPTRLERWIGVVRMPGVFNDHCLVMAHDEILFDPTVFHWPGMPPVLACTPTDVSAGISFQPLTT